MEVLRWEYYFYWQMFPIFFVETKTTDKSFVLLFTLKVGEGILSDNIYQCYHNIPMLTTTRFYNIYQALSFPVLNLSYIYDLLPYRKCGSSRKHWKILAPELLQLKPRHPPGQPRTVLMKLPNRCNTYNGYGIRWQQHAPFWMIAMNSKVSSQPIMFLFRHPVCLNWKT